MDTQKILTYLGNLSANNNREWHHAHKQEYKEANEQFEALIRELIIGIGAFDPGILHNEPKDLTFKLVRDTRFSHDNPPTIRHFGPISAPVGNFLCRWGTT